MANIKTLRIIVKITCGILCLFGTVILGNSIVQLFEKSNQEGVITIAIIALIVALLMIIICYLGYRATIRTSKCGFMSSLIGNVVFFIVFLVAAIIMLSMMGGAACNEDGKSEMAVRKLSFKAMILAYNKDVCFIEGADQITAVQKSDVTRGIIIGVIFLLITLFSLTVVIASCMVNSHPQKDQFAADAEGQEELRYHQH